MFSVQPNDIFQLGTYMVIHRWLFARTLLHSFAIKLVYIVSTSIVDLLAYTCLFDNIISPIYFVCTWCYFWCHYVDPVKSHYFDVFMSISITEKLWCLRGYLITALGVWIIQWFSQFLRKEQVNLSISQSVCLSVCLSHSMFISPFTRP